MTGDTPSLPRPTISTTVIDDTESGQLVELLYDDGANDETLICAAHGGAVEPGTAELALELATQLSGTSCWTCLGYDTAVGAFDQYHPPSSAITRTEYPLLDDIGDRDFGTVLSLHGLGDEMVLVGGGTDTATKQRVRDALDGVLSAPVEIAEEGEYAGANPDNFVNWLAADGGVQLELAPTVRSQETDVLLSELAALLRRGDL